MGLHRVPQLGEVDDRRLHFRMPRLVTVSLSDVVVLILRERGAECLDHLVGALLISGAFRAQRRIAHMRRHHGIVFHVLRRHHHVHRGGVFAILGHRRSVMPPISIAPMSSAYTAPATSIAAYMSTI